MKIVKIQLEGFGKLVDRSYEFGPGFNLIFGANEVGKSTLQQAILALLFGFFEEGRITKAKRAVQDSMKPWEVNASYAGSLIYCLDDSRNFRITRRFLPEAETVVFALPHGENISSQFKIADQGRLFVADHQLGMNKSVFENTCFVRQAELIALDSSATAITETLMRSSATTSMDTTVNDALSILETTIREEIGSPRAYTKPLAQANKRLLQLEEERSQVLEKRRELFDMFRELNQSEDRLEKLNAEIKLNTYLQTMAYYINMKSQLISIDEVTSEVTQMSEEIMEWECWVEFPVHLRDDVLRWNTNRKHYQNECRERELIASEATLLLKKIENTICAQEEIIKDFDDARDVSLEELPSIQKIKSQMEFETSNIKLCKNRLNNAINALQEEKDKAQFDQVLLDKGLTITDLAEMEQQLISNRERINNTKVRLDINHSEWNRVGMSEVEYSELERFVQEIDSGIRPAPKPRKGCRSILMGILSRNGQEADLTPSEETIYKQIKPIYTNYRQAQLDYESSQATLSTFETEIKDKLGNQITEPIKPSIFLDLMTKLEKSIEHQASLRQLQKTVTNLQSEVEQASQRYDQVRDTMETKLAGLGFITTDLQSAIQSFESQCERKYKLEKLEAEVERLNLKVEEYERDISDWRSSKASLKEVEEVILNLMLEAGIDCDSMTIEEAISEFEFGVKNHQKWEITKTSHEDALKRQRLLLEGQDRNQLQDNVNQLAENINTIQKGFPEWVCLLPEESYRDYDAIIKKLNRKQDELQKEQLRLKDTIQRISNSLRNLAEIDEQIHSVRLESTNLNNSESS